MMMKKCSTSRSRSSGLNDPRKHRHRHQDQFMSKEVNEEQNNSINPTCSGSCWKLYENPYFSTCSSTTAASSSHSSNNPTPETHLHKQKRQCRHAGTKPHINIHYHHHHCPPKLMISKHKLDQIKAQASTQIAELKVQLELEHKMVKKMEAFNRRAAKDLAEETKEKQDLEKCCDELREEVLRLKGEMEQMRRKVIQQQRQQQGEAEEKRVQIKHVDTQDLFYKYQHTFTTHTQTNIGSAYPPSIHNNHKPSSSLSSSSSNLCPRAGGPTSFDAPPTNSNSSDNTTTNNNNNNVEVCAKRKVSTMSQEPKNPHIRRGIKGFVEFPRAVKAMAINGSNLHSNSKSHFNPNSSCSASASKNRDIATKLECQKAQLRNFMKHKAPFPSTPLMMS